jgi:hypothetical protein
VSQENSMKNKKHTVDPSDEKNKTALKMQPAKFLQNVDI